MYPFPWPPVRIPSNAVHWERQPSGLASPFNHACDAHTAEILCARNRGLAFLGDFTGDQPGATPAGTHWRMRGTIRALFRIGLGIGQFSIPCAIPS